MDPPSICNFLVGLVVPIPTLPSTINPLVGAAVLPYVLPMLVLPNTLNLLPTLLKLPTDT